MKLYYAPGACSLSPHIVALEAGIPLELAKVDLKAHRTADGWDFFAINPKGYVPVLELDDGRRLTEGPAIVQYLADQKPESRLAPANGTFERYELMAWLTFINSEIHKPFGALFGHGPADGRDFAKEQLAKRFAFVDGTLAGKPYLTGDTFTVADAYLFVMLTWAHKMRLPLPATLAAFYDRVSQRPKVQQALQEEGLAK